MKFLLLSFILAFTLKADYLYIGTNICVHSLNIQDYEGKGIYCYTKSIDSDIKECSVDAKYTDFINGFEYKSDACTMKNDLKITGLTQEQWSFNMALLAHFLGFTQLFLINFLVILVARR